MEDRELLHQFAQGRSQAAFTELVHRHLGRVYTVALRRVGGDSALAEEVAQTVFAGLARKAAKLARRESITGWLFVAARNAAVDSVRRERRRQRLLDEARSMNSSGSGKSDPADWESLRPLLDEAVYRLNSRDREAVLLRFYEDRSYAEVGAKLKIGENAARMRVGRALDKLQRSLCRIGVTSSAAALATALSAQTTGFVAPSGLATSVAGAAASKASGSAAFAAIQFMSINKLAVVAAAGALVLAGTGAYETWINHAAEHRWKNLVRENSPLDGLRAEHVRLLQRESALASQGSETQALLAPLPEGRTLARALPSKFARTLDEAVRIGGPVFDSVDRKPMPIDQVAPHYPVKFKEAFIGGKAVVRFVVTTDGGVVDAKATEATAPEFGEAAVEAVSQWIFQPGTVGNRPVNTRISTPIVFAIRK
jgi:RNA polymerase sigma factor (sigma-70 family)